MRLDVSAERTQERSQHGHYIPSRPPTQAYDEHATRIPCAPTRRYTEVQGASTSLLRLAVYHTVASDVSKGNVPPLGGVSGIALRDAGFHQ